MLKIDKICIFALYATKHNKNMQQNKQVVKEF